MYFITGAVGFLACIIFMVLIILFAIKGKSCRVPLIAYFLSILLFLGSVYQQEHALRVRLPGEDPYP